jgi:hypothetical protein
LALPRWRVTRLKSDNYHHHAVIIISTTAAGDERAAHHASNSSTLRLVAVNYLQRNTNHVNFFRAYLVVATRAGNDASDVSSMKLVEGLDKHRMYLAIGNRAMFDTPGHYEQLPGRSTTSPSGAAESSVHR